MRRPLHAFLLLLGTAAVACEAAPVLGAAPAPSPAGVVTLAPSATSAASLVPPGVALPNPALTPGEVFAGATAAQICVSGYASGVRDVKQEQRVEVYAEYGIAYPEPPGAYELDHLVPLELGGDNSNRNLWPEPAAPVPGFHQKDQLEDYLHAAVCSGRLALAEAQQGMASDWYALYQRYLQP